MGVSHRCSRRQIFAAHAGDASDADVAVVRRQRELVDGAAVTLRHVRADRDLDRRGQVRNRSPGQRSSSLDRGDRRIGAPTRAPAGIKR